MDKHIWWTASPGFRETDVQERELEETARVFANIDSVLLNAPQLILNPIYDSIGFNRIPDDILRNLAIARICQPRSKLATVDYLRYHFDKDYSLDKALEIAKTIPTVTIRLPHNRQKQTQTLFLTSEQRRLRSLFDLKKYFG